MTFYVDGVPDYDRIPLVPQTGVGTGATGVTPYTQGDYRGVVDHLLLTNTTTGIILVTGTLVVSSQATGVQLPNGSTSQDIIDFQIPANATEDLAEFRDSLEVPEGSQLQVKSNTAASLNVHGSIHYIRG
jgi:hypothetical protein